MDPCEKHLLRELQALFCGMTQATLTFKSICNENSSWVKERLVPLRGA